MNQDIIASLKEIGLHERESQVYLAMLQLGESSIIPIAKLAGTKRTTVYNYLEEFIQLGLISVSVKNGKKLYTANNPQLLQELMRERNHKIQVVLPELLSLYKQEETKPSVQMFEGVEGVKAALQQSLDTSKKQIDVIPVVNSGYGLVGTEYIADYIERAKGLGIRFRSIRLASDTYSDYRLYQPQPNDNREIRIAPELFVPTSYIHIYDDKVTTFSRTKEIPYAMIVTSPSFAQSMRLFYEMIWQQSTPLNSGTTEPETKNQLIDP